MKKKNIYTISFVVFFSVLFLSTCKDTVKEYAGYDLGWNGDHAYVLKAFGIWDRTVFYVDGEREDLADIGKIAVSSFELQRQSELFARTRALFNFQEEMENYFNNVYPFEGRESEEEQSEDLFTVTEDIESTNTNNQTNGQVTGEGEFVGQGGQNPTIEPKIEAPSRIKKTINFRQLYERVGLKITLIEKIATPENDVNIIYLFSAKNLKQELAKAFNAIDTDIELRK